MAEPIEPGSVFRVPYPMRMVKRARAVPFVLTLKDWAKLPKTADEGRWAVVFNGRVEILEKVKG